MMAANWSPMWDVVAVVLIGVGLTGMIVSVAARRRRNVLNTLEAAGLRGGPITGHLLRRQGRIVVWRVALSTGRTSRPFLTQRAALAYLRRHSRAAPEHRTVRPPRHGLQWQRPTINRQER